MKYIQDDFKISKINALTDKIFEIYIDSPEIAGIASSGQFLHILCGELMLRRPISICEILKDEGKVRIVFEVKGQGTKWLSERRAGESINILGPLGNGFEYFEGKKAVFVGGGIGVMPLLDIAKKYAENSHVILGFRSKSNVILEDDYNHSGASIEIATDDGSYGRRGFVTACLADYIKENSCDVIYACGPAVMLKAVADISKQSGIECYISLEERMGCGIGACLVCACKTRDEAGEHHKHVCKDGPVFNAQEIVF